MAAAKEANDRAEPGSILVVDDLPNWREVLASVLRAEDHRVEAVGDAPAALHALSIQSFDVVVLDLRLEDEDYYNVRGITLAAQVHDLSPRTRIVLLTGFPIQGLGDKIRGEYPVDALWLKNPGQGHFDLEEFRGLIRRLVRAAGHHEPESQPS